MSSKRRKAEEICKVRRELNDGKAAKDDFC